MAVVCQFKALGYVADLFLFGGGVGKKAQYLFSPV